MSRSHLRTSDMNSLLPFAMLIAVLGTPYHLVNGYTGPTYTRRYLFAGIGVLIGCYMAHLFTSNNNTHAAGSRRSRMFLVLGSILPVLAVSLPELISFVPYLLGDVEGGFISHSLGELPLPLSSILPFAMWWFQLNAADPCVAIGSACATTLAVNSLIATQGNTDQQIPDNTDNPLTLDSSSRTARSALRALPAILGALAFCSRAIWHIMPLPSLGTALPSLELGAAMASSLLAYSLLSLCTVLLQRASRAAPIAARNICLAGLISIGGAMCFWWAATRFLNIGSLPIPAVITICITVCGLAAFACVALRPTKQPLKEMDLSAPQNIGTESAQIDAGRTFRSKGLAPRELEVALLALEGLPSQEAGERLGIKASTVRATLHRVYRKLDITGEDELRAKYGGQISHRSHDIESMSPSSNDVSTNTAGNPSDIGTEILLSHSVMRVSALTLLLYCFLPIPIRTGLWGAGNVVIVGAAAATALLSMRQGYQIYLSALHFPLSTSSADDSKRNRTPRSTRIMFALVIAATTFLATAWVSLRTHSISVNPYAAQCPTAVSALAYTVLGIAILEAFSRHRKATQASESHAIKPYVFEVVGSIILTVITLACPPLQLPVALACSIFLGLSLPSSVLREPSGTRAATHRQALPATNDFSRICKLAVGFALGCCFEELWRSITLASLASSMIPFSVTAIGIGLLVFVQRRGMGKCLVPLSCILALIVGGALLGYGYPVLYLSVVACMLVAMRATGGDSEIPAPVLAGFAAGALIAIVGVNAIQDQQISQESTTPLVALLGGPSSFPISIGTILACAGIIPAAAFGHLCHLNSETQYIAQFASSHTAPSTQERMEALLKTYGLSDVQTRIMLLTAWGQTVREIARDVNYAQSTVKALRSASYKQLSITGKQDLLTLLSQVDSL